MRFLEIALGSAFELEAQLDLSQRLGLVADARPAIDKCDKLKRSLIRFMMSVESSGTSLSE